MECLWKKLESTHWRYDKFIEPSWVLPLSDTWDDFIKSSAKSLRRKIRKASKRLESGELIVRSTQNELDVDQAFKVLVDLHQRRFVSKGERGVFADPRTVNFLQSATRSLCLKNQAEILIGFVGDEPFVAHLYLLGAKGPQLYQSGADPENMKLEPGHLVFTFAVQKAIEQGCEEFDFLRGDESYKSFWGAKPRTLIKTRFVSRAPVPTMINQSYRALRSAKTAGVSIWANCSLPGKTPSPQPK